MSADQPVRWTDNLLRRQNRLLAISLAIVLSSLALWLVLARDDGRLITRRVPAGPAAVGPTTWELNRIFRPIKVESGISVRQPVKGASFVSAQLSADLSAAPGVHCVVILTAGEYNFSAVSGLVADSAVASDCAAGQRTSPTYTFEVPDELLAKIDGVGVMLLGEQDSFEAMFSDTPDAYPDHYAVLPGKIS